MALIICDFFSWRNRKNWDLFENIWVKWRSLCSPLLGHPLVILALRTDGPVNKALHFSVQDYSWMFGISCFAAEANLPPASYLDLIPDSLTCLSAPYYHLWVWKNSLSKITKKNGGIWTDQPFRRMPQKLLISMIYDITNVFVDRFTIQHLDFDNGFQLLIYDTMVALHKNPQESWSRGWFTITSKLKDKGCNHWQSSIRFSLAYFLCINTGACNFESVTLLLGITFYARNKSQTNK